MGIELYVILVLLVLLALTVAKTCFQSKTIDKAKEYTDKLEEEVNTAQELLDHMDLYLKATETFRKEEFNEKIKIEGTASMVDLRNIFNESNTKLRKLREAQKHT